MRRKSVITTLVALLVAGSSTSLLAQGNPIRIGVDTPLSGTYAPIGQQVKWGLELAAKEINAAGGVLGRLPATHVNNQEESR